jgi:hypothetical protein
MAIEWWRSYHGAPTDAKWIIVSKRAQVKPGVVAAVWYALQDHASQSTPRGSVATHDSESLAAFYGWPVAVIDRVKGALREKGLIAPDGELAAWGKRQPKREDDSTERVRKYRERVTHGNATKRNETPDKSREDKRRKKNSSYEEFQKGERRETTGPARAGDLTASVIPLREARDVAS